LPYKENLNYKGHDLNTSTVTLDGEHVVKSLHAIKMEYTDPRTTSFMADDGTGLPVKNKKRNGLVTLSILQASETNKYLWDKLAADPEGGISIEHVDTNSPDMKSSAPHAHIAAAPMVGKSGAHEVVEWTFEEIYLDIAGAGYEKLS
jgi:hypothetical protein